MLDENESNTSSLLCLLSSWLLSLEQIKRFANLITSSGSSTSFIIFPIEMSMQQSDNDFSCDTAVKLFDHLIPWNICDDGAFLGTDSIP
mmetsp:Transcript_8508/g.12636  ORF Transcript_8508/g.12636 Transcript_8508/m.12636 type:complete len:89 (-) Transcript_8508:345-611(-)